MSTFCPEILPKLPVLLSFIARPAIKTSYIAILRSILIYVLCCPIIFSSCFIHVHHQHAVPCTVRTRLLLKGNIKKTIGANHLHLGLALPNHQNMKMKKMSHFIDVIRGRFYTNSTRPDEPLSDKGYVSV